MSVVNRASGAKGEPENPASGDEIFNKFLVNASMLISKDEAQNLGEVIMDLENKSMKDLTDLI